MGDEGQRTLIDLTEDDDAGKFGLGEIGDDRVKEINTWHVLLVVG